MKTRLEDRCLSGFPGYLLLWILLALFVGQFAALAAPNPEEHLSSEAAAVVQLYEAGIETETVLAFIETANSPFALSADDIIYLKDLGIDSSVITSMLERDVVLASGGAEPSATNYVTLLTNAPATLPQPVYVTNAPVQVIQFYDTLQPYGSWVQLDDLGWCWQPNVVLVNRTWRPYWQGGRWIYSDLGWYWQSDYSWGCVFHYGRWHRHPRCGWVWFPDPVWAPAWVSWRYSDAYCGWAPLPPRAHFVMGQGFWVNGVRVGIDFDFGLSFDCFNFVEIGRLHDHHPHLHGILHERVEAVFHGTKVVNNYIAGSNNRIVNGGLPPERFTAATHQTLRPAVVRDSVDPARGGRPDRIERVDNERVLYRTEVARTVSAPPETFRAQRVDQQRPTIIPRARSEQTQLLHPMVPSIPPASPPAARAPEAARPALTHPAKAPQRSPTVVSPGIPQVSPPRQASPTVPSRPQTSPGAAGISPIAPATPPAIVRTFPPQPVTRTESPRGRDIRMSNGPNPGSAVSHPPSPPAQKTSPPAPVHPTSPDRRHN